MFHPCIFFSFRFKWVWEERKKCSVLVFEIWACKPTISDWLAQGLRERDMHGIRKSILLFLFSSALSDAHVDEGKRDFQLGSSMFRSESIIDLLEGYR